MAAARLVARNAIVRSGGELVAKLASVAFYIAVARQLGEGGFGDFSFALALTTVLILPAGFGTEELLAREVARDRSRLHHYLSNVVAIKAGVSVLVLALAAVIVNVGGYSPDARLAVYLIGAGVAIENLGRTWHSAFQAFERMEFISISLIAQRVVTAAVGITALALGAGLVAVSLIFLAGSVLGFAVGLWALRRYVARPRLAVDRSRWGQIVKAGIPIGLIGVLYPALLKLDQSLLSFLGGEDNREVGFYGAAFRLIEATMFVAWAFGMALLPWVARHTDEARDRVARAYELGVKVMAALLLPVGVVFATLAGPLIELIYGPRYAEAVAPLRYLGIMTVLYGINALAVAVLIGRDRPLAFARACAIALPLNIALNFALIPAYGATGAAIAAVASSVVLTAFGAREVKAVIGPVSTWRPLAGPAVAGVVMSATILATGLPLVPAALLGGVVYLAVLLAVERLASPGDVRFVAALLRRGPAEES